MKDRARDDEADDLDADADELEADDDGYDDEDYEDEAYDDEAYEEEDEDDEAEPWDLLSQALGSLDELGSDEDFALDVSERVGRSAAESFEKVPLEQARNLMEIRRLADGVRDGSITIEVYRTRLKAMVRGLEEGLKIFKSDAVAQHLQQIPPDQQPYFLATAKLVETLVVGGQQMLRYPETRQISDVDQGMAMIEQGFQELDEMQAKALEIAREEAVRAAAMGD